MSWTNRTSSDRSFSMTDKEKLLKLLEEFGVTPSEVTGDGLVILEAKKGGVDGYSGFNCQWSFDESGKFDGVGIWE